MAARFHPLYAIVVVLDVVPAHCWGWPVPWADAAGLVKEGVEKAGVAAVKDIAGNGLRWAYQKGVPLGNDAAKAMRDLKVASQESKPDSKAGQASWSTWFSTSNAELEQHDMVIDLENLEDITDGQRGWPMTVRDEAVLNKILDSRTLKVAVIGMYNRGKTYILSKLAGAQLEHGRLVHTVGLSVVLNKANTIAFMDTAGENRAVVVNSKSQEEAELEIRRRVLGVQFLQEVVLEIADLVIVVVNQLTLEDQRYVAKVAKKLKSFEQKKQMIVIHNFKDTTTEQDLKELEQTDIAAACGAERQEGNSWWKTERFNALHVSMASEKSPAGDKLNGETLAWVSDTLNHRIPMLEQDVLAKSFLNTFAEVTRKWLPVFFTGFTPEDLNDKFELTSLQSKPKYIFHIGPGCAAKLQADLRVWEWEILNHFKEYELPYEVFQWNNETRVHVEIPGVFRGDPLNTEAVTFNQSPPHPFQAKFAWTEQGEQVLNVSVRMAAKTKVPAGLIIDAYRHQIAGDMPEPSQRRGTSVENRGKAQLKIDFNEPNSPEHFVQPSAHVHRNGLLIVTLKHASEEL